MSLSPVQWEFVYLLCWLAASGVGCWLSGLIWRKVVIPVVRRTRTAFVTELVETITGYVQWLVLASILYFGVNLVFSGPVPEFEPYRTHQLWRTLVGLCYVNLVFAITMLAYSLMQGALQGYSRIMARRGEDGIDRQVVRFFNRFAKVVVLFVAATIILQHFEVQITGVLATAGLASLAVAMAAQETLSNMFAGISLMFDKPFKRGDRISLPSGEWGDVLEIGLRSTKVLSTDQTVIVLPNAEIAKAQVVNHSAPNPNVRILHEVGVAYGSDMRKVKSIILDVLRENPVILEQPKPEALFIAFGDSALDVRITFWITDYHDKFRMLDAVNMEINDRFAAEGIEIPFPQRDVWMRSSTPAPEAPE